jgi:hypothetical protein
VDVRKFQQRCLARESALVELLESQRKAVTTMGRQLTSLRRLLADKLGDARLVDEEDWEPLDCLDESLPKVRFDPAEIVVAAVSKPKPVLSSGSARSSCLSIKRDAEVLRSATSPSKKKKIDSESVAAPLVISKSTLLMLSKPTTSMK